jgi:hypothetical protein
MESDELNHSDAEASSDAREPYERPTLNELPVSETLTGPFNFPTETQDFSTPPQNVGGPTSPAS